MRYIIIAQPKESSGEWRHPVRFQEHPDMLSVTQEVKRLAAQRPHFDFLICEVIMEARPKLVIDWVASHEP